MVEFEHSLFMLLLLIGVLSAWPPRPRLALSLLLGGVLLAFLPPPIALPFPLPWDLILALVFPLLLWQNARRLVSARWHGGVAEPALWALTVVGLGGVLLLDPNFAWPGALLFGLLAASMLWSVIEPEGEPSPLGLMGPLALIFLLAEIAPAVETPNRYIGGLFSGAAVGVAVAFLALRLAQRVGPAWISWVALGQVYAAFGFARLLDSSAVVAALLSVMIFVESGIRTELWPDGQVRPAFLNSWPGFGLALALFLFLGWETHRPLTSRLALDAGLGLIVGATALAFGQRLGLPSFRQMRFWYRALLLGLLVFPTLLLWPRAALLQPAPLTLAVIIAALVSLVSTAAVASLVDLQEMAAEGGDEAD
jgi:hypothetical protein